jgi:hypothetical protein
MSEIKKRTRRDWKFVGCFNISAKVYIARQINDREIWKAKYTRPTYEVYKCAFGPKCKAELRIQQKIEDKNKSSAVSKNSVINPMSMKRNETFIEVYKWEEHTFHDKKDVDNLIMVSQCSGKHTNFANLPKTEFID